MVGSSSGLTAGRITATQVSTDAFLDRRNPGRAWSFSGVVRIEPEGPYAGFGLGGDSGALVVEAGTRHAVGLFFSGAKDGACGYACPIKNVLQALNIELLGEELP